MPMLNRARPHWPIRRRASPRRLAVVGALALGVGAVVAPSSNASLTVNGTLFTPSTVNASTHSVLYYLQMHSTTSEELFSVKMTPPPFATVDGLDEGASIDGPTDVALQGPGTLGDLVQTPRVIAPCSPRVSALHGYATGVASVDVLLPPHSATTLAVRYAVGRRAPWVDTDFQLKFTVQGSLAGSYGAGSPFAGAPTVATAQTLTTAGPLIGSPTGAHILLSSTPQGTVGGAHAPTTVARNGSIAVRGRLLPAIAGRKIVLEWSRGNGPLHPLEAVRTDARGGFAARGWRPSPAGTYDLWASYPAQPGGLVADSTSCPLRFMVR